MSSAASPIRAVLEAYVAGRLKAERVVAAVTEAYYGERGPKGHGAGSRERWRSVMDVIERAHPGVVDLAGTADRPGFAIRLAERPFPREFEASLREAVQAALGRADSPAPRSPLPAPGLLSRLYTAVSRFFTAST
jgi:hypothetical protein